MPIAQPLEAIYCVGCQDKSLFCNPLLNCPKQKQNLVGTEEEGWI